MTKSLTEQWKNGTLPFGMYYVKSTYGDIRTDETVYLVGKKRYRWRYTDICCLEEVLAPVPTYDECQLMESEEVLTLKEQLKEANKIIKKLYKESGNPIGCDYLEKWDVK